jgi:hypothetical protein
LFALFILWGFGYETLWPRLTTNIEGTVVSKEYLARNAWTHGYGTRYVIRKPDGSQLEYVAGATDASLSRTIPLGAELEKRKWELSYSVNGKRIKDFPASFYFAILGAALATLFLGRQQTLKLSNWRSCSDLGFKRETRANPAKQ